MIRATRLVVTLLVALLGGGCYTMRAQLPGALRDDLRDEQVIVVGRVEREVGHVYLLGGLLNPPPEDLVARELEAAVAEAGADGVANLLFEARFSALDVTLSQLTLGLVAPRSYRVRADLVRIDAPPLPGRPLPLGARSPALPEGSP